MTRASAVKDDYTRPRVTDFGSLTQLTNDFDATFHGSVAKLVSLAVASVPVPGSNGGGPGSGGNPDPSGSVLNNTTTSATTPSGSNLTPSAIDPGSGTGQSVGDPNGQVLDSVSRTPSGGDPGATSPAASTTAPGSAGGTGGDPAAGSLPFTGYAVMLTAGVGAALAGTGAALRSRVRRQRA